MKRPFVIASILCACALLSHAGVSKKRIAEELSLVPRPELAARVTDLVRQAPPDERAEVASSALEVVSSRHPAAAASVAAAIARALPQPPPPEKKSDKEDKEKNGNSGNGNGNGNSNGNSGNGNGNSGNGNSGTGGGNGQANGANNGEGGGKRGHVIHPKPTDDTLPNGKPRHYPPNPPHRPVDPPHPVHYNKPRNH